MIGALPVVDSDNVLVGIVTVDDVIDVAEEEITEDMQKMAAWMHWMTIILKRPLHK